MTNYTALNLSPPPLCSSQITFNNHAHSGRIRVDLDNDVDINECRDWKVTGACECCIPWFHTSQGHNIFLNTAHTHLLTRSHTHTPCDPHLLVSCTQSSKAPPKGIDCQNDLFLFTINAMISVSGTIFIYFKSERRLILRLRCGRSSGELGACLISRRYRPRFKRQRVSARYFYSYGVIINRRHLLMCYGFHGNSWATETCKQAEMLMIFFFFLLPAAPKNIYYTVLFDVVIILTCLASLVLCTRSVSSGVQLQFVSVSDFRLLKQTLKTNSNTISSV